MATHSTPGWMRQLNESRQRSAQLIDAEAGGNRAWCPTRSAGIGLVAEGFPWKEGDNAVLPDNEFPSNQYPWLNLISRGVEIRRVPSDGGRLSLDALLASLRRPHADRQRELGRPMPAAGESISTDWPRRFTSRGALAVSGRDSGAGRLSSGRSPHADRLPGRRWAQVAAGTGRGGHLLSPPRAPRPAPAAWASAGTASPTIAISPASN